MIRTATKEFRRKRLSEVTASSAAIEYVKANIGKLFEVVPASYLKSIHCWAFDISRNFPDLVEPVLAGRIKVDAETGQVIPLTDDEIWDIQGRAETRAEHKRGRNPARGKDGLILPYQAKLKVNAYMGGYVAFYASSDGQPVFVPDEPPVWRVETALRLRQYGKIANLGPLDVNAVTGEIIVLSDEEIQSRQKRAEDAAITAKYTAASRI